MDYTSNNPETLNFERLRTFYKSPLPKEIEIELSNSPMKLAEAGFERSPSAKSDEVECSSCGIKYRNWSGESPLAVHRTLSPLCPFMNKPQHSPSPIHSSQGAHTNISKIRRQLFPDTCPSSSNAANFELPFMPKVGDYLMLFESHRLMTFDTVFSSCSASYAKEGFILNKDVGKVVCVFCKLEVEYNTSIQLAQLERDHEDMSPQCPFALQYDVGNISRDAEAEIRKKYLEQHQFDGLYTRGNYIIRHPQYEDAKERLDTFVTWPKLHASLFPSSKMVEAGFYYSGFMDKVKCYACGVSLYNWALPADPAIQHAIASPSCHFLADTWGAEFIRAAQGEQLIVDAEQEEITDEHAATSPNGFSSTSTPTAAAAAATSTTPWSSPAAASSSSSLPASPASSAASPGSPILDLEAIKAAMACQYTIEQIAHAVRKFFILSCGRYPNTGLLLGTLKAADENHIRLCEKTQEVAIKDSVIQATKSELEESKSVIQAKDSEIQAKDRELQRTTFEMQWRDLEVRTELEQQFVGQIQQAREVQYPKHYTTHCMYTTLYEIHTTVCV
ncbi:baculoviral iap repeat-containing protein 2 [Plakobranchus ocellatus]|uniref:Baculoviral iap repeat-containing protein 2 n=1 Tax=Plakobranchus ocellatus TaxID=259542 RepID=A0AAV4D879_9GAST|nr:baculoviral iap repeat-containing protein 2 [Plakobranchus ocellatus]